jgi:DNA mismatch endonuclease (patch repair protein)
MAAVRRKGNRSTELALATLFRFAGISGWRRQARLPGTPDFVFPGARVAVFADGCFWHGCPKHYTKPATSESYWRTKVADNRRRDARVSQQLRRAGWSVFRIWECSIACGRIPGRLISTTRAAALEAGRTRRRLLEVALERRRPPRCRGGRREARQTPVN